MSKPPKRDSDRRFRVPPPGFVVLRESEIDPEQGRADRWVCRGILDGRSIIRSGLRSAASACRAAWFSYDDACASGAMPEVGDVLDIDVAVAEALTRKFAIHREIEVDGPRLQDAYCVRLDSWENMAAALLAQIVADAGSIRRTSKVIDVPRSTLSAWIRKHRERGTWPQ
jgi:hypothetical protein